jgi:F-type H+-transporting ATPase subunit b
MTTLLIPLQEEAANPLFPHLAEVIASIVFALLLWFAIAKWVVPRFEATYAERTAVIQGGIERAEKAQAEAQAALEEYQAQLAEARTEAARIREDAKTQGSQILAEMREHAQAESARIRAAAQTQLEAERTQVMTQLRSEIGGLATTLASRIVGESLEDDERARRTVDRFLADLERQGEEEQAGEAESTPAGRP